MTVVGRIGRSYPVKGTGADHRVFPSLAATWFRLSLKAAAGEIGKNRTLVIAVGRDDVPSAALGLQAAHEPADLLAVDDKTLVAQLGADPPIAVSLELIADNDDFRDEFDVAHRCGRHIIESGAIESGARQSHQTASFACGKTLGPLITDVVAPLGRGAFFSAPFRNSISSACRPTMRSRAAIFASYS